MTRSPSLTVRLALLFAAVSATVLLTIGTVVGYLVEEHFEMLDMVELRGKLTLVEHVLAKPGVVARSKELTRQLNEALVGHHGLTVAVYAAPGEILYVNGNAEFPPQVLQGSLLAHPLHPVIWEHQERSFRGIAASAPGVGKIPAHSVALALDMAHHQEFMSAFRRMLWAALAKPRGARASALRSADVLGCLLDPGALAAIGRPRDEEAAEAAQLSVVALLPAFLGSLDGGDADYVAHSDAVAKFLLTHAVRARATPPHRSSRNAACAARASIERGCRVLGGAVRDSARAGEWP